MKAALTGFISAFLGTALALPLFWPACADGAMRALLALGLRG